MKNGESWQINPATRDYTQHLGAPVVSKDLKMPIYFRTMTPRTRWLYAPNNRYGSDFWQLKTKQTIDSGNVMKATEKRALAPIIEDGRASAFQITASQVARQGVALSVKYIDASGDENVLSGLHPIRL